jgi:predicted RNase H-like nuclease (RuvC/YqgF family)
MTSLNIDIDSIKQEFNSLREKINKYRSQGVEDTEFKNELITEINFFNSYLKTKVDKNENINTQLLDKISILNKQYKNKHTETKKLENILKKYKNLGNGLIVSLDDNKQSYNSIIKNIILKNIAIVALYYYILYM